MVDIAILRGGYKATAITGGHQVAPLNPVFHAVDSWLRSQERGITLDLGFSSFSTDAPEHIQVARPGPTGVLRDGFV